MIRLVDFLNKDYSFRELFENSCSKIWVPVIVPKLGKYFPIIIVTALHKDKALTHPEKKRQ